MPVESTLLEMVVTAPYLGTLRIVSVTLYTKYLRSSKKNFSIYNTLQISVTRA